MKKISIALVLVFVLMGCQQQEQSLIGLTKAKEIIASQQAGEIIKAKTIKEDQNPYYEIEVDDTKIIYVYHVDALSGEVRKMGQRDNVQTTEIPADAGNTGNEGDQSNKPESTMTMKEAQEIALQRVGGGTVIKSELDFEDDYNMYVYEIEIQFGAKEIDIVVNAQTKEIISYEEDHDD